MYQIWQLGQCPRWEVFEEVLLEQTQDSKLTIAHDHFPKPVVLETSQPNFMYFESLTGGFIFIFIKLTAGKRGHYSNKSYSVCPP